MSGRDSKTNPTDHEGEHSLLNPSGIGNSFNRFNVESSNQSNERNLTNPSNNDNENPSTRSRTPTRRRYLRRFRPITDRASDINPLGANLVPLPQDSFTIVLVDIKRAGQDREIHCVEQPWVESIGQSSINSDGTNSSNFVALSYRWGELPETLVDTNMGYFAHITSFTLDDFFDLCHMMMGEPDLMSIPYVWVDAICVDQKNAVRRKATIHRMTDIYKGARHIIAVPDLHKRHLQQLNKNNRDIISHIEAHKSFIYYTIVNNTCRLGQIVLGWLDDMDTPQDISQRKDILEHGIPFMNELLQLSIPVDSTAAQDNPATVMLVNAIRHAFLRSRRHLQTSMDTLNSNYNNNNNVIPTNHALINGDHDYWLAQLLMEIKHGDWSQKMYTKHQRVVEGVTFLADLIKDWSNRVWVISEFSIAKQYRQDKKLKLWFAQLSDDELYGKRFFEYHFYSSMGWQPSHPDDHDSVKTIQMSAALSTFAPEKWYYPQGEELSASLVKNIIPTTLTAQLSGRSFLHMILGAHATTVEDRFYAVLPISKYKNIIKDKETISRWHICTMLDVKLKLYEIMDAKDQWELLYLSSSCYHHHGSQQLVLPTFATPTISFNTDSEDLFYPTFNVNTASRSSGIQFTTTTFNPLMQGAEQHELDASLDQQLYSIKLTPRMFFILERDITPLPNVDRLATQHQTIWKRLGINTDKLSFIVIPKYHFNTWQQHQQQEQWATIQLVGNFRTSHWVVYRFLTDIEDSFDQYRWATWYNDDGRYNFDNRFDNYNNFKKSYIFKVY